MDFNDFINKAWKDHSENTRQVANDLPMGIDLITNINQISQMSQIVTHVFGEHLGLWQEGIELLGKIKAVPSYAVNSEGDGAIKRSMAVLTVAAGDGCDIENFTQSEQIRIYALTASVLSGQNKIDVAQKYMEMAVELAQAGIADDDPANRVLAITGNNLACSLEEKEGRTPEDTEMMKLAARVGRMYWEVAGSWLEVERAEYRLAMTFLKANELKQALEHAQACIQISQENNAAPLENFFGYEAMALVEKQRQNEPGFNKALDKARDYFEKLSADDKLWCESSIKKLENN
jgi:hypothetical protein